MRTNRVEPRCDVSALSIPGDPLVRAARRDDDRCAGEERVAAVDQVRRECHVGHVVEHAALWPVLHALRREVAGAVERCDARWVERPRDGGCSVHARLYHSERITGQGGVPVTRRRVGEIFA